MEEENQNGYTRRDLLKIAGGAGLAVGLSGAVGSVLAACGSSGGTSGATAAASAAASASADASGSVVSSLPEEVQGYYELATSVPLGPSKYVDFKPKNGPPWKVGYASSYAGNTWRAGARKRLTEYLIPKYKEAGLLSEVITTESNLNDATQIQQIRQLVDQGCDAIITGAPATTALNGAVKYAYDRGVVFVAWSGGVQTDYALNVTGNYALGGKYMGQALGKSMGGKGKVLIVQGIPGAASSEDIERGHKIGLADYPDIEIAGIVAGNWTDQIAKTEVLKFMSTHPEPLGGIACQSPGDVGVLSALRQSGRDVVPITPGGEMGPPAWWRDHPDWITEMYQVWPPGSEMQMGWEGMMRVLQSQGPKIASILIGATPTSYADLATLLPAGTPYTSDDWIEPAPGEWFPSSTMDLYFNNPVDPLTWKP